MVNENEKKERKCVTEPGNGTVYTKLKTLKRYEELPVYGVLYVVIFVKILRLKMKNRHFRIFEIMI